MKPLSLEAAVHLGAGLMFFVMLYGAFLSRFTFKSQGRKDAYLWHFATGCGIGFLFPFMFWCMGMFTAGGAAVIGLMFAFSYFIPAPLFGAVPAMARTKRAISNARKYCDWLAENLHFETANIRAEQVDARLVQTELNALALESLCYLRQRFNEVGHKVDERNVVLIEADGTPGPVITEAVCEVSLEDIRAFPAKVKGLPEHQGWVSSDF